jgi:hypothetical protein
MSLQLKDLVSGFTLGWYSDQGNIVAEFEVIEILDGKVARLKVLRSRRPELEGRTEHYCVRDLMDWGQHIRRGAEDFA